MPGIEPVRPSAEAGLHAHVAAVTGARSVVHVHTLNAVEAARRWPEGVVLHDLEMLKALDRGAHGDIGARAGDRQQPGHERARGHASTPPTTAVPAVLVAGHGSYVWGTDTLQARWRTEALDWLLGAALRAG